MQSLPSAWGLMVSPSPHPGQPDPLGPTEPGLGLHGAHRGVLLFLLLKNRASVRIDARPPRPEDSQEKTLHLHRPDLGCSDEQEKGEKEEQEQDRNHLAAAQRGAPAVLTNRGFPSPGAP